VTGIQFTKEPAMDNATDKKAAVAGAVVGGVAGGVTGGMAAGAAVGGMSGPVGAVVGAALGAAAGALVGKVAAVDPAEDDYWRANYAKRPYVSSGATYDDYGPAYRHGIDAYSRHPKRPFDELEPELSRSWGTARASSSLEWENAKHATRDAWQRMSDRVERAPGDSDRDGR
jgi:hypothetical protein